MHIFYQDFVVQGSCSDRAVKLLLFICEFHMLKPVSGHPGIMINTMYYLLNFKKAVYQK